LKVGGRKASLEVETRVKHLRNSEFSVTQLDLGFSQKPKAKSQKPKAKSQELIANCQLLFANYGLV
jgi:hypothetical protein